MKFADFVETYKESIAEKLMEVYPPHYDPAVSARPAPDLLRSPIGAQGEAINAVVLSLRMQRGTVVVGEMGTGKTYISVASANEAGFKKVLVLCPPHLTRKWKREIEETVPGTTAVILDSIKTVRDLRSRDDWQFAILSRERAKLGYSWKPAVVRRRIGPLRCPGCGAPLLDEDEAPLPFETFSKHRRKCEECGGALWQADKEGLKRFPVAEYIKKQAKGMFDLLIADEVHEYKGRGAAQGVAASTLANIIPRCLALTGTLAGGYASTLFHVLYRFSPSVRLDFAHTEQAAWVARYGFLERQVFKEPRDYRGEDGRQSKKRNYRPPPRERPGMVPSVLFHIIHNTVFVRLHEVSEDLPPYSEHIQLVSLDREGGIGSQEDCYLELYATLRERLLELLRVGSHRMLGKYLQSLLAYPDTGTQGETVYDPVAQDEILIELDPLPYDYLYPKERALLAHVLSEHRAGRKVLVYVNNTGIRDIQTRLQHILSINGFRAAVLRRSEVSPEHREEWVNSTLRKGVDVLICNPRLVQTGLDLVDFPTIIWFQTDYSIYTIRQASRRSWRIGQTQPVKVLWFAYAGTLQNDALNLVSNKLRSSLAIEGELSDSGLGDLAPDDDITLALARQIAGLEVSPPIDGMVFDRSTEVGVEWASPHSDEAGAAPRPQPALTQPASQSLFDWAGLDNIGALV